MRNGSDPCGKIFIAGTGRSGTTHLGKLLGMHPQIYHIPVESRFIVDEGGLEDLVERLTARYTPNHGELALKMFKATYVNERLGPEIDEGLKQLIARLTLCRHQQQIPGASDETTASQPVIITRLFARHFKRREELVALCRRVVDHSFSTVARKNRKCFWCEKTPLNLLSIEFLWEMFPEAAVIHIKRDPRGVFQSFLKQPWIPDDPEAVIHLLGAIYDRWKHVKERVDFTDRRYIEIKIEDMANNPTERMRELLVFLGADSRVDYPQNSFIREKIEYWRQECPIDLIRLCEKRLAEYFELMGYSIEH